MSTRCMRRILRSGPEVYTNLLGISIKFKHNRRIVRFKGTKMVRVLNVAEKNDAAKNLAAILSSGRFQRKDGFSKYNKLYEFESRINGELCYMVMTSVSGHLLNHAFTGQYKKWHGCSPIELFEAPVAKVCEENMLPIKRTLEFEARKTDRLIIWTDCDREGENIGFEIISVCRAVNPTLPITRAKFSEITQKSIERALQNLGQPDQRINDAVEVRSELDLRIGAAFTRFQTLRLQKVFPQALADILVSYGSCQFPTLGFVVERYKDIQNFIPEQFWKIKVSHEMESCVVEFLWKRVRLFDELACRVLLDKCLERKTAFVEAVKSHNKSKWRPLPLDTVELEKLGSRKLHMNAKETMRIAEKLYTAGYISYPRTETNTFPKELDLVPLIEMQTHDQNWGAFASKLLQDGGPTPRQGKKSDQAHPPIHPTKYTAELHGNEQKLYEFIVRHFLACCSKDAKGLETVVDIDINDEKFSASGLIILERNYLEVYIYEKWSDKTMPHYNQGQSFEPSFIDMVQGQTTAPPLLTEADLIALMEKHGIGTDATHAEHIETIKSRRYVGLQDLRFVPGELGMGLVEGYDAMGFQMSKPNLRAELESDLKSICNGTKDPKVVLREQINNYRTVFQIALQQAKKIDESLATYFSETPRTLNEEQFEVKTAVPEAIVTQCPSCKSNIVVKKKRDGSSFYLGCLGFPECRSALWFPLSITGIEVTDEICSECPGRPKKMKFHFAPNSYGPLLQSGCTACVGGCDQTFLETLGISAFPSIQRKSNVTSRSVDSGYSSNNNDSSTFNSDGRPVLRNETNILPYNSHASGSNINETNFNRAAALGTRKNADQKESGLGSDTIVCNCNEAALKLTVRKDGPNQGRQFYKCGKSRGQECKFFLWADDLHSTEDNDLVGNMDHFSTAGGTFGGRSSFQKTWGNRNDDGGLGINKKPGNGDGGLGINKKPDWDFQNQFPRADDVSCHCGQPAKRLTTQKEGANKGRQFYCCPKTREEQCGFFQWADEAGHLDYRDDTSVARGKGIKRKTPANPAKKRRCGVCGEEGHNRKNCPQA